MKKRHSLHLLKNKSTVAALLCAASAVPALGQSTISQIVTQPSGTAVSMDTSTITYIASQAGTTSDGYTYTNWAFLANDGTGSLEIFGKMPTGSTYTPTLGDQITASGTYSPFNQIPELGSLTAINQVSTGNGTPGAVAVTIPQLDALTSAPNYKYQEYLLQLNNVTIAASGADAGKTVFNTHANTTLTATDGGGNTLTVYQYASSYSVAGLLGGTTIPTGSVDILGICDVFSTGPEFIPFAFTPASTPPPPPVNNTILSVGPQANQNSSVTVTNSKTASAVVGAQVNLGSNGVGGNAAPNMVYAVLKGGSATTTLNLQASGGVSSDTTYYASVANGAHGGSPGNNYPIPYQGTDNANVGYNPTDTQTAGATIQGSLQFVNQDNSSDAAINVSLNAVKVLESRDLDAGASSYGTPVGDVLVGKTGSGVGQLTTVNSDATDYTSNALTNVTLLASSTSAIYTQKDPFSSADVANIQAVAPGYDQVFGGPNQSNSGAFNNAGTSTAPLPGSTSLPGDVIVNVSPLVSGTYGDGQQRSLGSTTDTYNAVYTSFSGAAGGVVGMGIAGENEAIYAYAQYSGFQAAAVTASGSLSGTGGNITLTNAATDDNIVTSGTSAANFGLRDAAWVTNSNANQDGWSSNLSPATGAPGAQDNPGTVIPGSQSQGDGSAHSISVSFNYNPALALAGSYSGGSYSIGLENGQVDQAGVGDGAFTGGSNVIQGATHNDLAPVVIALPNETGTGDGSGTYNFGGGTFTASGTTHLAGSFTQTGGSATFNQITGNGTVAINDGTAKLAKGHLANTVGTLSISGTGLLDITNNSLSVGTASLSSITALIAQAYDKGNWDGATGITSSTAAATPGTGIGVNANGGGVNIMLTWYGDTDLTGTVTNADLQNIKPGMANPTWANGDFNYDGVVNADDYGLAMLGAAESAGRNINVVAPEPAVLSAIVLPAIFAGRRRRRD